MDYNKLPPECIAKLARELLEMYEDKKTLTSKLPNTSSDGSLESKNMSDLLNESVIIYRNAYDKHKTGENHG